MSKHINRGIFVVFEGLDRSGKTTQLNRTVDYFNGMGYRIKGMEFPDRTTIIGSMIDNYLKNKIELKDEVIHLLYSANRWEKR